MAYREARDALAKSRARPPAAAGPDDVNPNRAGDVLELLAAPVLKICLELAAYLPVCVFRNADGARVSDTFQAGGDVDTITENIAVLDDDVADVDADAKFDARALGHVSVTFAHPALNGDRTAHGIDSTGKLDQYSIARRLYDAAGMLGNLGVQEFTAMHLKARKRALLVIADKPAVAGDIGGEDGGQPPLYPILGHSIAPRQGIDY